LSRALCAGQLTSLAEAAGTVAEREYQLTIAQDALVDARQLKAEKQSEVLSCKAASTSVEGGTQAAATGSNQNLVVKIGVIMPATIPGRASSGAVAMAAREANKLGGVRLEFSWKEVACDPLNSTSAVRLMLDAGGIDAIIGPECSPGCEASAHLTSQRDVVQVSYGCTSTVLSDKSVYPTVRCRTHLCVLAPWALLVLLLRMPLDAVQFVRVTSSYASWAPAIVAFVKQEGWNSLAVISTAEGSFAAAAFAVIAALEEARILNRLYAPLEPDNVMYLRSIAKSGQSIKLVIANRAEVLKIALAAWSLGMCCHADLPAALHRSDTTQERT
jgi:ABC-type branched-subunit amino acid transport system substrate-binding protein